MYDGRIIFSQLMDFVPWRRFQTCVNRYRGDYKLKTYKCAEQFRVMAFAQLTYRHSLREVDKSTGVQSDQTITLSSFYPAKKYPESLRRIRFYDQQTEKRFVFLTNNFDLPALTIAELYKSRWQIELFFKWIKQHLRIKVFYGTSQNAVKAQIWIAVSTYLLVAIVKKELRLELPLYTILQILSLIQFEKTPFCRHFRSQTTKSNTPLAISSCYHSSNVRTLVINHQSSISNQQSSLSFPLPPSPLLTHIPGTAA